jgi:hypothetical protein
VAGVAMRLWQNTRRLSRKVTGIDLRLEAMQGPGERSIPFGMASGRSLRAA